MHTVILCAFKIHLLFRNPPNIPHRQIHVTKQPTDRSELILCCIHPPARVRPLLFKQMPALTYPYRLTQPLVPVQFLGQGQNSSKESASLGCSNRNNNRTFNSASTVTSLIIANTWSLATSAPRWLLTSPRFDATSSPRPR